MSAVKAELPLHYRVFRKTACHLPHEGNVEQLFSMAKGISDCNMKSLFLRLLTKIKANKKRYKPSSKRVWDRYCQKFRGCRNNFSSASGESDESGSSSSDSEWIHIYKSLYYEKEVNSKAFLLNLMMVATTIVNYD